MTHDLYVASIRLKIEKQNEKIAILFVCLGFAICGFVFVRLGFFVVGFKFFSG